MYILYSTDSGLDCYPGSISGMFTAAYLHDNHTFAAGVRLMK